MKERSGSGTARATGTEMGRFNRNTSASSIDGDSILGGGTGANNSIGGGASVASQSSIRSGRFAAPQIHPSDRPRFESYVPKPTKTRRNGGIPMLTEDLSYSRVGVGLVWRDADSSQRALADLSKKRKQRLERRRAAGLLFALVCLAISVHVVTHSTDSGFEGVGSNSGVGYYTSKKTLSSARDKIYDTESIDINYGVNNEAKEVSNTADMKDSGNRSMHNVTKLSNKKWEIALSPTVTNNLISSADPPSENNIPFFFHVPRTAGQSVTKIVGKCLSMVQASSAGVREGHGQDEVLAAVEVEGNMYVNVDTTCIAGLQRAKDMGLAKSNLAKMVTSSYFLETAGQIFSPEIQGRAFVILRPPIDRAVSMYHYTQASGVLADSVTLEDYAQGNGIENNWLVRFLTGHMEGELKSAHLDEAKEVIKKKFLIGFMHDFEESVVRIMKYMGWEYDADEMERRLQQECIKDVLNDGTNPNPVGEFVLPKKGTQAHALITWQTQYDLKLYDFAKVLFEKQTKQYGSKQRKKELKKKLKDAEK